MERIVLEEAIKATREYMAKELVREQIQQMVQKRVNSGEISTDEQLKDFWKTVDMAVGALKMVSLDSLRSDDDESTGVRKRR